MHVQLPLSTKSTAGATMHGSLRMEVGSPIDTHGGRAKRAGPGRTVVDRGIRAILN